MFEAQWFKILAKNNISKQNFLFVCFYNCKLHDEHGSFYWLVTLTFREFELNPVETRII